MKNNWLMTVLLSVLLGLFGAAVGWVLILSLETVVMSLVSAVVRVESGSLQGLRVVPYLGLFAGVAAGVAAALTRARLRSALAVAGGLLGGIVGFFVGLLLGLLLGLPFGLDFPGGFFGFVMTDILFGALAGFVAGAGLGLVGDRKYALLEWTLTAGLGAALALIFFSASSGVFHVWVLRVGLGGVAVGLAAAALTVLLAKKILGRTLPAGLGLPWSLFVQFLAVVFLQVPVSIVLAAVAYFL